MPFLARWPGQIPAGAVSDETICHVDLMATCAAILGATLPPDAGVDSYNILPALRGQKLERPIREATVLHSGNGKFVIRQGPWVLIDAPDRRRQRQRAASPTGSSRNAVTRRTLPPGNSTTCATTFPSVRNLYAQKPEIVERLKAVARKVQSRRSQHPRPCPTQHAAILIDA